MTNKESKFEALFILATHPNTPAHEAHTAAIAAFNLAKKVGIAGPRRARVFRLSRQGVRAEA